MIATPQPWVSGSRAAARAIGTAIIRGSFGEGDRLPLEAELAAMFSVSRNTLREAMRLLVAKGMVEVAPRRGTKVLPSERWNALDIELIEWSTGPAGTDPAFMREILRVRAMLEPFAAADAARNRTETQLAAIADLVARMEQAAEGEDRAASVEADLAFHLAVADAAGNRFIACIARAIMQALRTNFDALISVPGNFRRNIPNHHAVLDRVAGRDPDGARRAMEQLLRQAECDTDLMFAPAAAAQPGVGDDD
ncbi:FCD domain-containing protein [Rhodobacteraceae bacterium 2CG4]|uniref:FCD domain-containing protein n=1 Tax=Halovulum marinum TaxID=2662447 RepID=A0A6L5YVV4_9RHOB|nr:FadR/GntR family transcriptional regulator [Halovulum marinum]MSU88496.1 FCD domain-containing protein [Halovulum marinum]